MGRLRLAGAAVVVMGLAGALIAFAAETPADAQYIGAKKCRLCHLKEYKSWEATKHASNFDVLIGDERSDPECVKCHVTGFGKPGGFVSEADTPDMTNVGCESCHGAGSAHAEAAKSAPDQGEWAKKIDKTPVAACTGCHNPHVNQKANAEARRAG